VVTQPKKGQFHVFSATCTHQGKDGFIYLA
jgi:phenylpropionate dioxygenase-like ring-hydroxylating dioxygenase large terminal subunit